MSLDPSPLSPQPTPLLHPTDPVPGRGSALVGAAIAVVLAAVVGFVSTHFGNALIFLPQGLAAQARGVVDQLPQVQGVDYYWSRSFTPAQYGYDHADINTANLGQEANDYHMNLAVITVTANESYATGGTALIPTINYNSKTDLDTYPDQTYIDLIAAAKKAGLAPVLRLDVRVLNSSTNDPSSTDIGLLYDGSPQETTWFNSYTQFAVHFAQLAAQNGVPMMIIGHDLSGIATDTSDTAYKKPKPCEGFTLCYGQRDQEWRHLINALRNPTYQALPVTKTSKTLVGGGYTGRLTFAASGSTNTALNTPEYSTITWWDALDVIGVDANFSLTPNNGDLPVSELQQDWHGTDTNISATHDYFGDIKKLSEKYTMRVLFTAAGYESQKGADTSPMHLSEISNASPDPQEQLNDMQALYNVFSAQNWWLGVIWSSDYPISPRSAGTDSTLSGPQEPNWSTNTEWAGDCLQNATPPCQNPEKDAGAWLRSVYKTVPLDDNFWASVRI